MAQCGLCGGHLILLGHLGRTPQFRCRHCGMIFSAVRRARRDLPDDQILPDDQARKPHGEQSHEENQNAAA